MSKIKRKKVFVAIALSSVLLLSAGLVAATRDGGFHKGFHKDPERMRDLKHSIARLEEEVQGLYADWESLAANLEDGDTE